MDKINYQKIEQCLQKIQFSPILKTHPLRIQLSSLVNEMYQEIGLLLDFLGKKAFSAISTNPTINLSEIKIIVENGGHIYEISYDNNLELIDIEKSIISTFKFIK